MRVRLDDLPAKRISSTCIASIWILLGLASMQVLGFPVVERYNRTIDDYIVFRRVVDTVQVRSTGEKTRVMGGFVPQEWGQYVRYADELGTIFTSTKTQGMHVLGFRYPLRKNERISFSIDRTGLWFNAFAPVFPDSLCHEYVETTRIFPFWKKTVTEYFPLASVQETLSAPPPLSARRTVSTIYTRILGTTASLALLLALICLRPPKPIGHS